MRASHPGSKAIELKASIQSHELAAAWVAFNARLTWKAPKRGGGACMQP